MIPKIIHYCWISGDPFPEKIKMCYNSWKRILPDYEIIVWDYEKVHALNVRWCEEAMACKKYAFVADYVRFYALYNYGGIYLDSDVEVLKSFDDLLGLRYFVGNERCGFGWEAAIIGAEKELPWIKTCLDYYKKGKKPFVNKYGLLQTQILPYIMNNQIRAKYIVKDCNSIHDWIWDEHVVYRFPQDFFSPKGFNEEINPSENTYTIHHFTASWQKQTDIIFPLTLSQRILGWCKKRASFIKHQILHL